MGTQLPVDAGLFTWPSEDPRLIGSRCAECGVMAFPTQVSCPRCNSERMTEELLGTRGTLWTFTTQGFLPKSPPYAGTETAETFSPYAVGYVELPGQLKVETRLTESDPAKLRIGVEMELAIVPFKTDERGNEIMTFAFRPTQGDVR